MDWWVWLLFGMGLLLFELLTPGGFYILFFGIGAIIIGVLAAANIAGPVWLQWLLFSLLSVVTLVLFRRPLLEGLQVDRSATDEVDSMIGETAIAQNDIPVGAFGKAELRGTMWSAHNIGSETLARGERCRVESVKGLVLGIRAES